MNRELNGSLARNYTSKSQIARVVTEDWVSSNLYCPLCGYDKLIPWPNNKKGYDFYCNNCRENFQLKSSSKKLGKLISGAEYYTLMEILENEAQPNLLLMWYNIDRLVVESLIFIPRVFFTSTIVQKRKPLAATARRAGWTGCNLHLNKIPQEGKIYLLDPNRFISKEQVLFQVSKIRSLFSTNREGRQWYIEVLNLVNHLPSRFTVKDIYSFESYLQKLFPNNNNIKAKLRQQLQRLRDDGIIIFCGKGIYEKT